MRPSGKADGPPIVGLLGAVCSGKSSVARMMAERGFDLVDADSIGHEVLERSEVRERLREAFGPSVFGPGGLVDRRKLGQLVFHCEPCLEKLNSIVHPLILEEIDRRIRRAGESDEARPVVLDAALLMETRLHEKYCDLLVFVDAPQAEREARARRTRSWGPEELQQREGAQMPPELKKQHADLVISNSGTERELQQAVFVLIGEIGGKLSTVPGRAGRPA